LDQRRKELGFKDVDPNSGPRDDLIPTHSYIFGAWVEAGIGGALFWLFFLCFTIRTFLQVSGSEPLLLLFAFGGFQMVWDTFFSPLGMPTRFLAPFLMAAIVQLSTLRVSSKEAW
jgi:hypothetical protein